MKVFTIIIGVLLTIGGFICVFTPGRTFLSSGWALGVMILISGLNMVILYFKNRKEASTGSLVGGIIMSLLGIFTIVSLPTRVLTDLFIAYAFGAGILIYGIFQIMSAVKLKKVSASWGFTLAFGILDVLLGGYCFIHPVVSAMAVGALIAFIIITQGFNLIALGASLE